MAKHSTGVKYSSLWDEIDARAARGLGEVSTPRHSTGDLWIPPYAPVSAREAVSARFTPAESRGDVWDNNGRTL